MYNERTERFSIRDVILQVLFVALFILLLVWLFPSKSFINKKVDPLLDTIFRENIMSMKEAAKDYYTLSRLPQKVGDVTKLTLGEMLDKKLLLEFTDKYGETCDVNDSYVEITKMDDEYVMKVNLKCSKQEDYILVHMGCYDYCSTTICEKQDPKPVTPVIPDKPKPVDPDKPKPEKQYICEYSKKTPDTYTAWSDWSNWTTDKLTISNSKLEEVGVEDRTTTETKKELTGYKVIKYLDGTKPIYELRQVAIKKKTTTVCTAYGTKTTTNTVKTVKEKGWKQMGTIVSNTPLTGDAANKYELLGVKTVPCDENCSITTTYVYIWSVMEYETTYETVTTGGEYGCIKEETKTTPVYADVNWLTGYETSEKKEPVYKEKTYKVVTTYYRKRTRKLVPGSTTVKWDSCTNSSLPSQGYVFTGNKKEK